MGVAYKGGTNTYHSFSDNIGSLSSNYSLSNGYFGTKGESKDNKVRNISSSEPQVTAKDFYDKAAHGGIETPIYDKNGNIKGKTTQLKDGTIITYRPVSSSDGTPAVDISITKTDPNGKVKTQKIHFVKEKD